VVISVPQWFLEPQDDRVEAALSRAIGAWQVKTLCRARELVHDRSCNWTKEYWNCHFRPAKIAAPGRPWNAGDV
jgi:hypothetical protein